MMEGLVKFQVGEVVYSTVDEGRRGMVMGVLFRPGHVVYKVSWSAVQGEMEHYDIELTTEEKFQVTESDEGGSAA